MKFLPLLLSALLLVTVGCSSSKKKEEGPEEVVHEELKRDYTVVEALDNKRPGWVIDAELWAREHSGYDTAAFRYFSYETEPKVNREMACNLAKANARADIASEITTFISKSLGTSSEGQAGIDMNNPKVQPLREFTENTLAEKVQSMVYGAAIVKNYWEKRKYEESKGAAKNFIGFTCAVLIQMDSKSLAAAVKKAAEEVVGKADDPETKENVKKALEKADENFIKARKGQI
ncbi:MAG: hypothetical protein WCG27_03295 [Pseudomonadota bacterium]